MGWQRNRREQANTVAVGCHWLPIGAHGKEGVDGSSPSEGFAKCPLIASIHQGERTQVMPLSPRRDRARREARTDGEHDRDCSELEEEPRTVARRGEDHQLIASPSNPSSPL
jgi:hypothetical protein